jgi:peptidoglycan hydrolase-like protein with peptidoglycan-binding domain
MLNSQVNDLQRALASDPSIYPEGQITGKFGALTKKAVERFQTKYGLKVTGIVDSATRAVLNNVFNKPETTNTNTISGVNVFIEGTAFNQTPVT